MYARIKNKQIQAYNKYMENTNMILISKTKEIKQKESHIISVRIKLKYNKKHNSICIIIIYIKLLLFYIHI